MFFLISGRTEKYIMNKIVLITGATSGIGEAAAILLAKNNFDLILTGRRNDRLLAVKKKIADESKSKVYTLNFDIRNLKRS